MKTYYIYFENDVWGNKKEGYEVNNTILTSVALCFKKDDFTNKLLIKKLKKAGIIKKGIHLKSIDFDSMFEDQILINGKKDGYPLGYLQKVELGQNLTMVNMHREFKPENFDIF